MTYNSDFQSDFNIDALRRVATERCDDIAVRLLGNPSSIDRIEMRWGRKGSKSLKLRDGVWYDHENGVGGDIIALVMVVEGCGFVEACDWLRAELALPVVEGPWRIRVYRHDDDRDDRICRARALFAKGQAAAREGQAYFEGRGLDFLPDVARQMRVGAVFFFDAGKARALLMPFRDCASHDITGVHRIALDAFALDGRRLKKSLGVVMGSAMMIGPPGAPGPLLTVCEGLETGVGAIMGGINEGSPVWCLSGASMLAAFAPVVGVERLIIAADNDPAGRGAAKRCAALWDQDAFVDIVWPDVKGTDFADAYRRP